MQVRASLINQSHEFIVFINDITRIRMLEKAHKRERAIFLSSVAHELRTPLNSIIPIARILKGMLSDRKTEQYLTIILNAALHLENVVEDALDMTRIENNKFEIYSENFNLRDILQELMKVMEFQV